MTKSNVVAIPSDTINYTKPNEDGGPHHSGPSLAIVLRGTDQAKIRLIIYLES